MEDWQKTYIDKHWARLIDVTISSTTLRALLKQKSLLSAEEEDRLAVQGRNHGRFFEAKELYTILKTRVGSYEGLLDTLHQTNQTEAWQTLQHGLIHFRVQSQSLLDLPVLIRGKNVKLEEAFPSFTAEDAMQVLCDKDIRREISGLLSEKTEPLRLDGELPHRQTSYITRSISNRLLVEPKVFGIKCQDVFVFKGVDLTDVKQLAKPDVFSSSTKQRTKITSRHIYLDDDEDWDDLKLVSTAPIHLIAKEGEDFVLQRTTNISNVIRENSVKDYSNHCAYTSEENFIEQLLSEAGTKGALICDIPGMGKTWFMRSIAEKSRQTADKTLVYFIQLPLLGEYLEQNKIKPQFPDGTLHLLLKYALNSKLKLASHLVKEQVKKHQYNILFVMDGFDEIKDSDVETTTLFLKDLINNDRIRLVISSRPHMREHLEKTFKVVSYDILPFGRKEQVDAIVNNWRNTVTNGNFKNLYTLASKLIEQFKLIQRDNHNDILGVPLRCSLLAVVNERRAFQICKPDRRNELSPEKIAGVTLESISDLYERFVEACVVKAADINHQISDEKITLSIFHTYMALHQLFPEIASKYFEEMKVKRSEPKHVIQVGLMSYNCDSKLEFIHRSMAEYFTGRFFAHFWMNIDKYPQPLVKTVVIYFVSNVLLSASTSFKEYIQNIKVGRWTVSSVNKKIITRFKNLAVMVFMNSVLMDHYMEIQNIDLDLLKPSFISFLHGFDRNELKRQLSKNAYSTFIACMDCRLDGLFSLIIKIQNTLLNKLEKRSLLSPPPECFSESISAFGFALLFCRVAENGSPEHGREIFRLYEDSDRDNFKNLFRQYPETLVSPLEIAIARNDMDMVEYLIDFIHVSWERRFIRCLLDKAITDEATIKLRILIMEKVLSEEDDPVSYLRKRNIIERTRAFNIDASDINVGILSSYALKKNISLNLIDKANKRFLLRVCLKDSTHEDFEILDRLMFSTVPRDGGQQNTKKLSSEICQLVAKEAALLQMQDVLTVPQNLYVERTLTNHFHLDPKIFRLSCRDVFVFKGVENKKLSSLIYPHISRASTNQRRKITSRHIRLVDDEDWYKLVSVSEAPIHFVQKNGKNYVVERSSLITDVLIEHSLEISGNEKSPVSDTALVDNMIEDPHSKGVLVCGVPGIGKTWLLQHLARRQVEMTKKYVVYFVRMHSLSISLRGISNDKSEDIIRVALGYCCPSETVASLIHEYIKSTKLKMVFFLDGFDHVPNEYIGVTTSFLLKLHNEDNVKCFISSRPHVQSLLEKTLNLISYDILPFGRTKQIKAITSRWTQKFGQSNTNRLTELAIRCVEAVNQIQHDDPHDFLGIPFRCYLLAQLYEKNAREVHNWNMAKEDFKTLKSEFDMFEELERVSFSKIVKNEENSLQALLTQKLKDFHTHKALELLCPDIATAFKANHDVDPSLATIVNKIGIISLTHGSIFEFVSASFAEYFVGKFFSNFWNNNVQYSACFVETVGTYFILNMLEATSWLQSLDPDSWHRLLATLRYSRSSVPCFIYLQRLCTFKNSTILSYMNSVKHPHHNFQMSVKRFQQSIGSMASITTTTTETNECAGSKIEALQTIRTKLTKVAFFAILACIGERLTTVLSLLVNLLTSSFTKAERHELLKNFATMLPGTESTTANVLLLCRVAMTNPCQSAMELFKLFEFEDENTLLKFCLSYPRKYWSPLEVAATNQHLDMVAFFVDKVELPVDRLVMLCAGKNFRPERKYSETDVKIIESVLIGSKVLGFVAKSKLSFKSIPLKVKRLILRKRLNTANDIEAMGLLLTLCGKTTKKVSINPFKAEEVLRNLDVDDVMHVFSELGLGEDAFKNCSSVETLRVLAGVLPDFTFCNVRKWSYLHYAVWNDNVDWVRYLIEFPQYLDQTDKDGNTPLHCLCFRPYKYFTQMTRLLVENGANVYACNKQSHNVVQLLFSDVKNLEKENMSWWINYMLDKGFRPLWQSRDRFGRTPRENLVNHSGKNNPRTKEVLRILQTHCIT